MSDDYVDRTEFDRTYKPMPSPAMAETKLTAHQTAAKYARTFTSITDGDTTLTVPTGKYLFIQDAIAAINDYAAQQQAEHERVLAVLRDWQSNFKSAEASMQRLAALLDADKESK